MEVDPMALAEAADWRAGFGGTPGVLDFISQRVSLAKALALVSLLRPATVDVRGCILLELSYDDGSFEAWWEQLSGDCQAIESVMNHIHLWDIFEVEAGDPSGEPALRDLAEAMAQSWRCALAADHPDRTFVVEIGLGAEEYGPTVSFTSSTRS